MLYLNYSIKEVLDIGQLCQNRVDKKWNVVARSFLQLFSERFSSQERTRHSTAI